MRFAFLMFALLLIFQFNRLLFYFNNKSWLRIDGLSDYIQHAFYGIRFDISSIFTTNLPFIILALLPFSFLQKKSIQIIFAIVFIISNFLTIAFDMADIAYFPYVHKRMTADVFHLMENKADFINLLPSYAVRFIGISCIIILLFVVLFFLYKKVFYQKCTYQFSIKSLIAYILICTLSIIGIRGGIQLRPILINNAILNGKVQNAPLVLNTPFSIYKTFEVTPISPLQLTDSATEHTMFPHIKQYSHHKQFNKQNIVIIILESFGKLYTGIGGRKSYTPFLDSLMTCSKNFTHAYANAFRSVEGIPAILSSIPGFMNDAIIMSQYANNHLESIASILKNEGYSSAFFHGGSNGTMSFDTYTANVGFEKYFGRDEYNNDKDYDGTWGIYDEPFLQFFGEKLNTLKQPFVSAVFTLSSHEPFSLPPQYKNHPITSYKEIFKGISYSDIALQHFFHYAKKQTWFTNTLFVITADHNYIAAHDSVGFYNAGFGKFSIPILFFHPEDTLLKGVDSSYTQQIDILPGILDYLGYNKPFFSYGQSLFDTTRNPFVYMHLDAECWMYIKPYFLYAVNKKITGMYLQPQDSLMRENLLELMNDSSKAPYILKYQSFVQWLHNSTLQNKQSVLNNK